MTSSASPPKPFDNLFAFSPSLADRLPGVERAAQAESPVLILGEPGTGRSALARAFHQASRRRSRPRVEIDPGNFPVDLFESELFGHREGAFTGADRAEPGRVALAEGGTLVLDHVEELPLSTQPKLLRLLAERRFTPLGGREQIADVRFVAIAAEDLEQRVDRGAFRQDLYFRLEVLSYRLPPLRERLQDLEAIRRHLLRDLEARFGYAGGAAPRPRLSRRAERWMAEYDWPGNIRQLRNVLERAWILSTGERLDPDPPAGAAGEVPPRTLREVEESEIRRALAYSRGHQGRAAELLGISRKALWEKRRRFGIP